LTAPRKSCERAGCTNFLRGRQKRYCSNACRATAEHAKKRVLAESVALDEVRAQVTPVIKEALTESVLQEIGVLTKLLPEALVTLQKALHGEDPAEARQAAALILRYTVGNQAVAPEKAAEQAPAFNINFGSMPSQGDPTTDVDGSVLDGELPEVEELRICLECGAAKDPEAFVGESNRCLECHGKILENIRAKHPGMLPSGA
jgi:hypothetical protein